jgi:DNA polymerase I-like protein with 3'-5' exonuclease and polymerase domains
VRTWLRYTECKNDLFQGIAADGAKEALYELVKAGYRVVHFIHDEYIIEIPLNSNLREEERRVSSILIDCMVKHCPDVAIEVESFWMTHWQKKGTHVLDENGQLIVRK